MNRILPTPPQYSPEKVGEIWRVPYQEIYKSGRDWSETYNIPPAHNDEFKSCLVLIDVQNTFCIPGFELFVGGRSGKGAVEDNRRLIEFIYRNLDLITKVVFTLDSHLPFQIFHESFLVDKEGNHPSPNTLLTSNEINENDWVIDPNVAQELNLDQKYAQNFIKDYSRKLEESGKFGLTVWPYHAMLGSIGHALVSSVEEAIFFHSICRRSQPNPIIKGDNPLTESYSAVGPEVLTGPDGDLIARDDDTLIDIFQRFDRVYFAGQAKSHCLAWTVSDILGKLEDIDASLIQRINILEDCTSPVVIPGILDFTEQSEREFQRFSEKGVKIIQSTSDISRS